MSEWKRKTNRGPLKWIWPQSCFASFSYFWSATFLESYSTSTNYSCLKTWSSVVSVRRRRWQTHLINVSVALINVFILDFTPPVWFFCFTSFNHWLLIVNASCNFLIYVSVGDKFKTTIGNFFKSKLGCCFPTPPQETPPSENVNKAMPLTLVTKTASPGGGAVTTSVAAGNVQVKL